MDRGRASSQFQLWYKNLPSRSTDNRKKEHWNLARKLCENPLLYRDKKEKDISRVDALPEASLVNWEGISVHWFRKVFMNMPEVQRMSNFDCPLWFIRNFCIPIMLQNRGHDSGSFIGLLKKKEKQNDLERDILGQPKTALPTVFISYTGSYSINLFNKLVSRVEEDSTSASESEIFMWMDLFCVDQFAWNEKNEDEEVKKLKSNFSVLLREKIKSIKRTALFLYQWHDLQALKMLWVIWELYSTVHGNAKLDVYFPTEESEVFYETALSTESSVRNMLMNLSDIDTGKAIARNEEDRKMIMEIIGKEGIFNVNSSVIELLHNWMASVAIGNLERRIQKFGESHPDTLLVMSKVATLHEILGDLEAAEFFYKRELDLQKSRKLGSSDTSVLKSTINLASTMSYLNKLEEAESLSRVALNDLRMQLGDDHDDVCLGINTLASILRRRGNLEEAEVLSREVLEMEVRKNGRTHGSTLSAMNNLANVIYQKGDFCGAENLYRESLNRWEEAKIRHDFNGKNSIISVMLLYARLFKSKFIRNSFDHTHPSALLSASNLASALHEQEKFKEAEEICIKTLNAQRQHVGSDNVNTLRTMFNLCCLWLDQNKNLREASKLCEEAIDGYLKRLGDDHPDTKDSQLLLQQIELCIRKNISTDFGTWFET